MWEVLFLFSCRNLNKLSRCIFPFSSLPPPLIPPPLMGGVCVCVCVCVCVWVCGRGGNAEAILRPECFLLGVILAPYPPTPNIPPPHTHTHARTHARTPHTHHTHTHTRPRARVAAHSRTHTHKHTHTHTPHHTRARTHARTRRQARRHAHTHTDTHTHTHTQKQTHTHTHTHIHTRKSITGQKYNNPPPPPRAFLQITLGREVKRMELFWEWLCQSNNSQAQPDAKANLLWRLCSKNGTGETTCFQG